ncbi:MAG: nucleoside-triphosphatase [Anaerolineales bacterium]
MSSGKIIILTGDIQSGKTSLCQELAQKAKEEGIQLAGLLSPGVFQEGKKIGIDVINLKNREQRHLAVLKEKDQTELETRRWSFYPEIIQWGNQALINAVPCDLLVVDELGQLEFNRGEGWISGLAAVDSGSYQSALVVIRPSLLKMAYQRWEISQVIDLDDPLYRTLSGEDLFSRLQIKKK